jgi:hypothetical protein
MVNTFDNLIHSRKWYNYRTGSCQNELQTPNKHGHQSGGVIRQEFRLVISRCPKHSRMGAPHPWFSVKGIKDARNLPYYHPSRRRTPRLREYTK